MKSHIHTQFKGKVNGSRALWKYKSLSLWSKDHHIVIIESSCHILHESHLTVAVCDVLQHLLELLYPLVYVTVIKTCHTTELGTIHHIL